MNTRIFEFIGLSMWFNLIFIILMAILFVILILMDNNRKDE